MKISPPPTFSAPSPFTQFEGYWVDKGKKRYLPVVSKKVWKHKEQFLDAVEALEKHIMSLGSSSKLYRRVQFRGKAHSRLEKDVYVGSTEYYDDVKEIAWPGGFAAYYIGKFNVMPTKRFYEYVMNNQTTDPLPVTKKAPAPPREKILNPNTNRYILRGGKLAEKLIKEDCIRHRNQEPTKGLYKFF